MEVGKQYRRVSEQAREVSMAQKSGQSNMEKMMELFLQMRQEDQKRETRREQDRLEREERRSRDEQMRELRREKEERDREEKKEREDRERDDRREERQIQLLTQLKEAQPVVPQQVNIS